MTTARQPDPRDDESAHRADTPAALSSSWRRQCERRDWMAGLVVGLAGGGVAHLLAWSCGWIAGTELWLLAIGLLAGLALAATARIHKGLRWLRLVCCGY